jgi:hypothetical protein
VPVDDALHVGQLRDHLRDALEQRGIEILDLVVEANGEPGILADSAPRKGRVYWPAAEVVMTIERPPTAPPQRKGRSKEG